MSVCIKADLGRKQGSSPCYVTSSQERQLISRKPQSWRKLYVCVTSQSDCIEALVEGVEMKIMKTSMTFLLRRASLLRLDRSFISSLELRATPNKLVVRHDILDRELSASASLGKSVETSHSYCDRHDRLSRTGTCLYDH